MAEYIDRGAIMQAFANYVWPINNGALVTAPKWNEAVEIVRNYPAADVTPVVHCRECVHLGFKDWHGICEGGPMCGIVRPYDYCSHGVRKENDNG